MKKNKSIVLLSEQCATDVQHQIITILLKRLEIELSVFEDEEDDYEAMVKTQKIISAYCGEIQNISRQILENSKPELPSNDEVKF